MSKKHKSDNKKDNFEKRKKDLYISFPPLEVDTETRKRDSLSIIDKLIDFTAGIILLITGIVFIILKFSIYWVIFFISLGISLITGSPIMHKWFGFDYHNKKSPLQIISFIFGIAFFIIVIVMLVRSCTYAG
ncbi:MAG: hypothetical protein ACOCV8_04070 [Spirochaetota bacterium]